MDQEGTEIDVEQELLLLQFWAIGVEILRKFTPDQLRSVPGVEEAIGYTSTIPTAIGWGDEPEYLIDLNLPQCNEDGDGKA
jgi:hypothetical protein